MADLRPDPSAAPFAQTQHTVVVLEDARTGEPLRWGKLRWSYDVCGLCGSTEPVATVQGKRGAWYHLHPQSGELTAGQRMLLAQLDDDAFEDIFEDYSA